MGLYVHHSTIKDRFFPHPPYLGISPDSLGVALLGSPSLGVIPVSHFLGSLAPAGFVSHFFYRLIVTKLPLMFIVASSAT